MFPEFELWTPHSLPEALAQIATAEALPLAGGTNVIPDLRSGRHKARILLDISRLDELHGIRRENGHVIIGGGVTLGELLASPSEHSGCTCPEGVVARNGCSPGRTPGRCGPELVSEHAGPLVQAARLFANPLVRNRATLAGNLVDASPAADTAPPLLVLDAEVNLVSQAGCRTVPLKDFFIGVRKTVRRPDELLSGVRFPVTSLPPAGTACGYYKLGLRKADAISVVSVAIRLEVEADGRCRLARIALGSVAPTPIRAIAAEESLCGQALTGKAFVEAGELAAMAVSPISDLRASADYRRRMVKVLVQRLLTQAADQIMLRARTPEVFRKAG